MGSREKGVNRNDMRWRRTERHLMEALADQLEAMPLDKVKVTELCRNADVSKATFYLHYRDVYELADAFVDARVNAVLDELGDPCLPFYDAPAFVGEFVRVFRSQEQKAFLRVADENRMAPLFMDRLLHQLKERLDAQVPAPEGLKPKVGMAFLISGLCGAVQANGDVPDEQLEECLTDLMGKVFERHFSRELGHDALSSLKV